MKKKIMFLSGTRADYGKMKPLMQALEQSDNFEVYIFVCGMHLLETFGNTYREIEKDGYKNIYVAYGIAQTQNMSLDFGNTVGCLSGYVNSVDPDMIVVHGDRTDALAGAVVGALNNILVAHIEGGELSGTIDESIRHAISKFAHMHFVCTEEARKRLIQLGEEENRIYVIGSPDIDVMLSEELPSLEDCKERYDIPFQNYGIFMYHPVTTEYLDVEEKFRQVIAAIKESNQNWIVVYPNSDLGSEVILSQLNRLEKDSNIKMYPSLRFEYFLSLLKNADVIMGNSSAGIRESGIYGVPAIDIGTRQSGRYSLKEIKNIQHVNEDKDEILEALSKISEYQVKSTVFGRGNSTEMFMDIVNSEDFWNVKIQKKFIDYGL